MSVGMIDLLCKDYQNSSISPRSTVQWSSVDKLSDLKGSPLFASVGKAVPTGARKGGAIPSPSQSRELCRRLNQHANSLDLARNIRLEDFTSRYLVVVPVWIPLAERFLVEHYKPVWNVVIDGFGNHDPGKGRRAMKRPCWDIVHPGRPWAARLEAAEKSEDIIARLNKFLDELHG
jgi:hypothetical protein